MNTLGTLLKTDLLNTFSVNRFFGKHSKSKLKTVLIIIGTLIVIGIFEFSLFTVAFSMGIILKEFNALFFLIGVAFIVETIWSLTYSVRLSSTYLFKFKDFDLLMSMPIKPSVILCEKAIKFYITNLVSSLFILFPFLTVYGILSESGIMFYILAYFMMLFVPMIPIVAGSVVSFPLLAIAARFGKTDLINSIFTIIITIATLIISMGMSTISSSFDINNISINTSVLWSYLTKYPPAIWFTRALVDYSIVSVFLFFITSAVIFLLFIVVFNGMFEKINLALGESSMAKAYKFKEQKESSVFRAMVWLEMKNYFSSYLYVLNTGIGAVMAVVFTITTTLNLSDVITLNSSNSDEWSFIMMFVVMLIILIFLNLSPTTASTISLEGKKFWMLKSFPVKTNDIFIAKSVVNLTLNIPSLLICVIAATVLLKLNFIEIILLLIIPLFSLIFSTFAALYINILFPKMDWSTPQQAIKQSMSVMLSMLLSFVVTVLIAVYTIFTVIIPLINGSGTKTYAYIMLFILAVIWSIVAFGMWMLLKNNGAKRLHKIE